MTELIAALAMAAAGLLGGLACPALLARVPEPPEDSSDAEDKIPYATLAAVPRLGLWCAAGGAIIAGSLGYALGDEASLPVWWLLAVGGVLLSYVDWRTHLLPKPVVVPAYPAVAVLLLVAAAISGDWDALVRAGIAWIATFGLFALTWLIYPRGIGYGDVRLSGVLGMALGWLGWAELLTGMYAAFILGALVGWVLSVAKLVDRSGYAFGPFLFVGAWVGVLAGPTVGTWLG